MHHCGDANFPQYIFEEDPTKTIIKTTPSYSEILS